MQRISASSAFSGRRINNPIKLSSCSFHRKAISTLANADFPGSSMVQAVRVLSLVPSQPWPNHIVSFSRRPRSVQYRITGSSISQALRGLCGYLFHLFGSQALFSLDRTSDPQSRRRALDYTRAPCQRAVNARLLPQCRCTASPAFIAKYKFKPVLPVYTMK